MTFKNIFAAIAIAQVEIAIALAHQRLDGDVEAEMHARQFFGFSIGNSWRRNLEQLPELFQRRPAVDIVF